MDGDLFRVVGVDLIGIAPEGIMGLGGLIVLLLGSGLRKPRPRALAGAAALVAVGAGVAAVLGAGESRMAFDGAIAVDPFATLLKVVFAVAAALSIVASVPLLTQEELPATEYLGLMLFSSAGMMLMASAADLVTVFLALETFSLALYVMAAYRRHRLDSQEGALKYFLTGSFATAFFLYGVALTYGAVGSTRFSALADTVASGAVPPLAVAGFALILVGLAFKVAAVPFHMWTPDVYEGAPAPVTGFMAAGSKVAGFAVLLRLISGVLGDVPHLWEPALAALAVVTMIVGSLVAVAQTNVKRMLAYSAIAHSGFLLIGVIAASERGVSGSLFYLAVYAVTIVAAFAAVYAVGRAGEDRVSLDDYRGLYTRRPGVSAALALLLVSLAGVPPTGGFWAKFEVFSAGVEAGQLGLVIVAVLASAVAAFFYLRLIVLMFLEEPRHWATAPAEASMSQGAVLAVSVALVAVLGVFPTPLLNVARGASLIFR